MIIKQFFKAHFVQKTSHFKSSIVTTWNPYFCSVGGRFLTRWSSDIISRLILSKNKLRWCFQFLTKIMGLPLWKSQYVHCVKSIFFSVGSLVFYLDCQQALFQGPFCLKTSEDKNINVWPNSWANPLERYGMTDYIKSIFC